MTDIVACIFTRPRIGRTHEGYNECRKQPNKFGHMSSLNMPQFVPYNKFQSILAVCQSLFYDVRIKNNIICTEKAHGKCIQSTPTLKDINIRQILQPQGVALGYHNIVYSGKLIL